MTLMTATATITGSPYKGLTLRLVVLTGAAAVAGQSGADANSDVSGIVSITRNTKDSRVFAACSMGAMNPAVIGENANTYEYDAIDDYATNGSYRFTGRCTALTPDPPTAVSMGWSPNTDYPVVVLNEILAGTGLTEDASSPAVANSSAQYTVTTGSFDPPAGSLLVAIVSGNSNGSACSCTMSDNAGGLNWTKQIEDQDTISISYAGIFIADIPGAAGTDSATAYPASYRTIAGGSGSWTDPDHATGAPDSSWATWTAP